MIYFTQGFAGLCVFNLAILAAWIFLSASLTPFEWWLSVFLGTFIAGGGVIIFYIIWNPLSWIFDREADQLLLGTKVIGRLRSIRQIRLSPERGEDEKLRHVLSVVIEDTGPCCLYQHERLEELRGLANVIAEFVGVTVAILPANEEPRSLMSFADSPQWLQVAAGVVISSIVCGPLLLLTYLVPTSLTEKLLYLGMTPLLMGLFLVFLYRRGKRLAFNEPDTGLRVRLLERLDRDFKLGFITLVPASLVGVGLVAWLIFY
jgi:hypothetical protein